MNIQIIAKEHGVTYRDFLRCLRLDGMMSAIGRKPILDIIETDRQFSRADSDYDNENCTYKGKQSSMSEYVREKFGNNAVNMIKACI